MADTGFLYPSAETAGSGGFANPGNAFASDNVWANEARNNDSHIYYNHGFSIPAGATINGMIIGVEGYIDVTLLLNGDTIDVQAQISINAGSSYSTAKTNSWFYDVPGINQYNEYGGAADLWGLTPTDTSFTDANLRVRYTVTNLTDLNETMYIDMVRMKVYYTSVAGLKGLAVLGVGK